MKFGASKSKVSCTSTNSSCKLGDDMDRTGTFRAVG